MSTENPFAGQGAVLLDIGGDIGALVVTMPESLEGEEIEVVSEEGLAEGAPSQRGHEHDHSHGHDHEHSHGEGHRPHVAVVHRPVVGGQVPSLVFPELAEGSYVLVDKGSDVVRLRVAVRGGEVTTATWPG
jgi:hypothetical protein